MLSLILLLQVAAGAAPSADTAAAAQRADTGTIGFRYEILARGAANGANPSRSSAVKVRYRGTLADGAMFDSSAEKLPDGTAIFPLRGLIAGFQSALLMMRPGDRWKVVIPPGLAYGFAGHRLSGKELRFEIELVDHAELPPVAPPNLTELPPR